MLLLSVLTGFVGLTAAFPASQQAARQAEKRNVRRQSTSAYPPNYIDVPINHFPGSDRYKPEVSGTFKQRYYVEDKYYKPGGPVFLYIGGETSGPSRFANLQTGIIQILASYFNGLGVILENRYYGESFPFNTSTTDELRFLTTEQTIADNAYFATHATFPGISANLSAPGTPWILYGGSLAGAQTAFSVKTYNDLLFGGIGASATVQAMLEYPQWYDPIIKFAPSDCVSYIIDIVNNIDTVFDSGDEDAIQKLKDIFGLGALKDNRDFAMTIAFPIGGPMFYPTNTWQELGWTPTAAQDFWYFCRNVTNLDAPENITQVDYALSDFTNGEPWTGLGNYANYVKNTLVADCDGDIDSTSCYGTQNETYWADITNSADRSYLYSTCSEQGAYQVAPRHGPSLISRILQVPYTQQWCTWAFPPGEYNSIPDTPDLEQYNKYGGFNIQADRLALIDGNQDVWLDLCYHSNLAPQPRISSDLRPSYLIADGGHHWDSNGILNVSAEPQFEREAHLWEIRTIRKWLDTRK